MSSKGFLKKQVSASEREGRTRPALRSLVLGFVRQASHDGSGNSDNKGEQATQVFAIPDLFQTRPA